VTTSDLTVTLHDELDNDLGPAWDKTCARLVISPFQDRVGAAVRAKAFGQAIRYAVGRRNNEVVFGAAITFRRIRPLPDRLTITRGPWAIDDETFAAGTEALCRLWSSRYGVPLLMHIDPARPASATWLQHSLGEHGFHLAPVANFHPHSLQIDLGLSEADLLGSFRKRTRGMLKKAEREGLQSWFGTSSDVSTYAALHAAAARHKHYGLADEPWMRQALEADRARLVLTEDQGEVIGGAFLLRGPTSLYYFYGATKPGYKGPGSYHGLWHVIRWAKEAHIGQLDLGALPEEHEGIVLFKRGFGGTDVVAMPELERVFRPAAYRLWLAAQSLRQYW
jgi:hypothetical protein